MLKKLREDYERHGHKLTDPGLWTLATYRYGQWLDEQPKPVRWVGSKIYGAMLIGIQAFTGNALYKDTKCGEQLTMPHGRNILVHPESVIGDRVTIEHHVTLATTRGRAGAPTIGSDVILETGAKILGPVKVGDGATVTANSIVATDVPPGATATGVPARIFKKPAAAAVESGKPSNGHTPGKDQAPRS
jgi:serine O-acetyltransferase